MLTITQNRLYRAVLKNRLSHSSAILTLKLRCNVMRGKLHAKLTATTSKNRKKNWLKNTYVLLIMLSRTKSKICARIELSELRHHVFIWSVNYCHEKPHLTSSSVTEPDTRDWKVWFELKIFFVQFLKKQQKY